MSSNTPFYKPFMPKPTTRLELIKRIILKQEATPPEKTEYWLEELQSLSRQISWITPLLHEGKLQLQGPTDRVLYREPEATEEYLLLGFLRGASVFDLVEDLAVNEDEEKEDEDRETD